MMGSTYGEGFFGGGVERQHSRSGSVSSVSSSSLSLVSRPGSASGGMGCVGPDGSVYRTGYGGHGHGHGHGHGNGRFLPHAAHLSSPHHPRDDSSSATSAFSTDLSSPADSPPTVTTTACPSWCTLPAGHDQADFERGDAIEHSAATLNLAPGWRIQLSVFTDDWAGDRTPLVTSATTRAQATTSRIRSSGTGWRPSGRRPRPT